MKRMLFPLFILSLFFLVASKHGLAGITGTPDKINVGTWVQHPGIVVTKLFKDDDRLVALFGDGENRLHAYFSDGTSVPGFPKTLDNHTTALSGGGIKKDLNFYVNSTPAVRDINGDGNPEIFVGSGDGYVYGFDNQGNSLPRWPQFTGVSTGDGVYGVYSSPAVVDLDGDGNFEVVVGAWSHFLYVWKAENGDVEDGWPIFNNADTIWSSPAIANIDNDNDFEIFYRWRLDRARGRGPQSSQPPKD